MDSRRRDILILAATGMAFIILIGVYGAINIQYAPAFTLVLYAGLIVVTMFYAYFSMEIARETREQAKATQQQADASVKMAKEMRNARSPYITIRWVGCDHNNRQILAALENEGFGPALNPECYLTHKGFDFTHKLSWCTTFKVGEKYPFSLLSENFDFKALKGLAINCDYGGGFGGKFRSILRFKTEQERIFEILEITEEELPK